MINLHNHTTFSDGRFEPQAIIEAAIAGGLTHIGISDHFRTAKLGATAQYVITEYMDAYVAHIRELAARYASQITVLVGLEIDFSKRTPMEQLWQQGFKQTPLNDLDYVLFEYVSDDQWDGLPLTALLSYRRWIRVPVGLAHSHLSSAFGPNMSVSDLVQTLEQHSLFIELCPSRRNAAPAPDSADRIPYYRVPGPFNAALWDALAGSDVLFSIGTDTHDRLEEVADIGDAWAFLQEKGLASQLVTSRYWPRAG